MPSHSIPHKLRRSARLALAAVAATTAIACAGPGPQVNVLGVSSPAAARARPVADRLVVFVEVINRTDHELELSRLEYRLSADAWFDTRGRVALGRRVEAGSSVVVEIPVEVGAAEQAGADVPYTLEGRLVARDHQLERSWSVKASGELRPRKEGVTDRPVRVHVAAGD